MKRIFIADDHDIVRSGLRAILETQPDWEVCGEANNGRDAISLSLRERPDILIVDYAMPLVDGIEVTRQIKSHHAATEVLMFTMHDSEEIIQASVGAGVGAFILKSDAGKYLIAAVEALLAHKPFIKSIPSELFSGRDVSTSRDTQLQNLSARERSVLKLIAEGYSNKEMAEVLGISVKTIESHRAAAMRKLDVNSVAGLVRFAIRNKLIEP
jgi:DNA-binding NarL/FixJ family response regulator